VRFLVAMFLMIGVLIGTNLLFPPVPPDPAELADSVGTAPPQGTDAPDPSATGAPAPQGAAPAIPSVSGAQPDSAQVGRPAAPGVPARDIVVEGPLARFTFSTQGATLRSAQLLEFPSVPRDGPVELIPEGGVPMLGPRILLRSDTLDLRGIVFESDAPESGIRLAEGGGPEQLTFRYRHPSETLTFEVTYTFRPEGYVVYVQGRLVGLDGAVLLTDLGSGIGLNELRPQDDRQVLAFVTKHSRSGIDAERLVKIEDRSLLEGPLEWVAYKSKYFVNAVLPGTEEGSDRTFGGALIGEHIGEDMASAAFAQGFQPGGEFAYRLYMGPQERARLVAFGNDLENVNPYGWRFLRPLIRPFTGIITAILIWMHQNLNLTYGLVLIVFGVLMRIVMFPLHHKAMRAQLKNMAVQPKIKEIQTRFKDKPEQLQKEMMKLYKEDGFNPLAGCLPMLLPWPVLVALFFVFQNTIELRGVPFAWLPDLSAADPLYILPVLMGVSMFLLQWISVRAIPDANPQMKMMMWIFPIVFTVMFANFASGLNLYYLTANIAMLPQSWWLAEERKRHAKKESVSTSPKDSGDEDTEEVAAEVVASAQPSDQAGPKRSPKPTGNKPKGNKSKRSRRGKR